MKKLIYIFYLFPLFLFYSCEQPSEQEDIPYFPKLVIRGILSEGKPVQNIYIGRSMPVSVKISSSFTDLTDASAAIIFKDQVYPLTHTHNGLYKNDTLQIIRGEKYSLLASWQTLSANAETTVPVPGKFELFGLQTQGSDSGKIYFLQGKIYPVVDEVYAATWVVLNLFGIVDNESDVFGSVISKNSSGFVNCTTANIPPGFVGFTGTRLVARLFIYDHPFLDFFNSQSLNQVSDAIFGQTGSQVKWNVKGNGIGMFVGRIDTLITK
jgi:hypothetical protein